MSWVIDVWGCEVLWWLGRLDGGVVVADVILLEEIMKQGFHILPVDITKSASHDLSQVIVKDYIINMIRKKTFACVHAAPPCNTYSCARWPKLRIECLQQGLSRALPAPSKLYVTVG